MNGVGNFLGGEEPFERMLLNKGLKNSFILILSQSCFHQAG